MTVQEMVHFDLLPKPIRDALNESDVHYIIDAKGYQGLLAEISRVGVNKTARLIRAGLLGWTHVRFPGN